MNYCIAGNKGKLDNFNLQRLNAECAKPVVIEDKEEILMLYGCKYYQGFFTGVQTP